MRARHVAIGLLAITVLPIAIAQHHQAAEQPIDGSKHPELISDTTAYRLFLATYAGADNQHRKLQSALFQKIGISQDDQVIMTNTLNDFNVRFPQILGEDAKETALNPSTDHRTFVINRDLMMDDILRALGVQLSRVGFQRLNGYVQGEKQRMRISPELERRRQ